MGHESGPGGTQLLQRALDVLMALSARREGCPPLEIATELGIPPSTVYRILQALELRALVSRTPGGLVRVGPAARRLETAFFNQLSLEALALSRPVLEELAQKSGGTVLMTVPGGAHGVCVQRVDGPRPTLAGVTVGLEIRLFVGALGKVLLAYSSKHVRESVALSAVGYRYPNGKSISSDTLSREIERIRTTGVSVSTGELQLGTIGVSAPVVKGKHACAGISVALPIPQPPARVIGRLTSLVTDAAARTADAI